MPILLDSRKGRVECLKCGRSFMSWDRRKNRLCGRCKEANEYLLKGSMPEALGIPGSYAVCHATHKIRGYS